MKKSTNETDVAEQQSGSYSRRKFLMYTGAIAGTGLLLDACRKEQQSTTVPNDPNNPGPDAVNLGSGDFGILNYAYALEQLEAAFYTQVALTPYSGITPDEMQLLGDIRDHEIAHREFFKNALGSNAITSLSVDFSTVDFSSRESVLGTAKVFEDLGVSAYNGAGKLIESPDYLLLAGKIVSVEARHAGYIRDLLQNGSFADSTVVDMNGLDTSRTPNEVLTAAAPFIKNNIDASNLPTS